MKSFMHHSRLTALAAAMLLAACTTLPATVTPAAQLPAAFAQAGGLPGGGQARADWWTALADPALDELVRRGLAGNLDLQQAAERVEHSRALAAGSRAELWPSGGIGIGTRSNQASATQAPGLDRDARRRDVVESGINLSWEIDLFGRLRHHADAASARTDATAADEEGLRLAVAAEIAHAWFALQGSREQAMLTRDVIDNRRATLSLVARRAAAGYSAPIDEARARAELAAAQADLPVFEAAATVATHRLAVLLGSAPSGFDAPAQAAITPSRVDLRLPDVQQWASGRPDLRAAEAMLRANELDVAAVRAEFLPRLTLTGVLGFVAGSASGLSAIGAASWFVAPNVSLPVFDHARIEARLAAAKARQREALLHYRQRVLLAVEEVENALARVHRGQAQLAALQERSRHARVAEGLARKRYEAGASDLLELLDAQRGAQQAELGLSSALTAHRQQVVALHRALAADVVAAGTQSGASRAVVASSIR